MNSRTENVTLFRSAFLVLWLILMMQIGCDEEAKRGVRQTLPENAASRPQVGVPAPTDPPHFATTQSIVQTKKQTPTSIRPPSPTPVPTSAPTPSSTPEPSPTPAPSSTLTSGPTPTPKPKSAPTPSSTPRPAPTTWPSLPPPPTRQSGPPISFANLENAVRLEADRSGYANRIRDLNWVADGVVGYSEIEASEALIAAALWYPAAFDAMMETPWVQDDITRDEAEVIYRLHELIRDGDTPQRQEVIRRVVEILSMPFLDSVESHDALAVRSLYQERYRGDRSAEFLRLMAHPALDEITDDEAKVVLLLAGTNQHHPESVLPLLDTLVRGEGIYVEERVVNLRYSGQITLAIIRHVDQATPSVGMERFEHAIRTIDDFMGWPVHTNRVTLYLGQSTSGAHYGTHITSRPALDGEDYGRAYRTVAHESGHLFWTSRGTHWIDKSIPPWMKEGAAEFLTIISENVHIGRPMDAKLSPCRLDNIRDLESAKYERGTPGNFCLYSLGQRTIPGSVPQPGRGNLPGRVPQPLPEKIAHRA